MNGIYTGYVALPLLRSYKLTVDLMLFQMLKVLYYYYYYYYYHHHHHISVMELGHLLNRPGLTYPEVSSKVYHDSFCQLGSSVALPWVIYFGAFYLHVVSSFTFIPVTTSSPSSSSSSSSSYICHGVGPLVEPSRSHISRSLFKGLP